MKLYGRDVSRGIKSFRPSAVLSYGGGQRLLYKNHSGCRKPECEASTALLEHFKPIMGRGTFLHHTI